MSEWIDPFWDVVIGADLELQVPLCDDRLTDIIRMSLEYDGSHDEDGRQDKIGYEDVLAALAEEYALPESEIARLLDMCETSMRDIA